MEIEKFTGFDHGRISKLDEEIESLIQQERALFFIEENLLKAEHNELVGRLTKLQAEREELTGILSKQDRRIARTLELEAIIEEQGGRITEFSEDLYSAIIDKIVVKERTCLVFYLKNGLAFEEKYSLKRGHDIL